MFKTVAAFFGPGLITASLVIGPGSVTVATRSGALFGYDLLFALVILMAFMITYVYMSAKVGVFSQESIMTLIAGRFGRAVSVILGVSVFFICCSFQAGDVIGVSTALATVTGLPDIVFKLVFPALCLILYFFSPNVYAYIERTMLVMVLVMLVSFLANLFMAGPDAAGIAAGLLPKKPAPAQMGLLIAMSATNFVVAAAFYQSYLVKEKGWTPGNYRKMLGDTVSGIGVLFLLVGVITITSAAVLKPRGIDVKTAGDMAVQLEPLLGKFAKYLFCAGLFAASFSSLAVNALTGATLLSDSIGKGGRMCDPCVKGFATAIMVFGLTVSLIMGGTPVKSIVFLQKLTLLTVPVLALGLIWAVNSKAIRQKQPTGVLVNGMAVLGYLLILYLFYNLIRSFGA